MTRRILSSNITLWVCIVYLIAAFFVTLTWYRPLLDHALHVVHLEIGSDHALAERDVVANQRIHGLDDHALGEAAHLRNQTGQLPMTIYENIAFGIRFYEKLPKSEMDDRVEKALRDGALWNEVKDKLNASGLSLSGGQQQRLCIAVPAEPSSCPQHR